MPPSITRRHFVSLAISGLCGTAVVGCGTILHPERKGQRAGNLDWSIVALDGIGLLLFLVPGVIAFAVDFNNGSIYLPEDEDSQAAKNARSRPKFTTVPTNSRRLTHGVVENVIAQRLGRPIGLNPGTYQTRELETLEQFWDKVAQLEDA